MAIIVVFIWNITYAQAEQSDEKIRHLFNPKVWSSIEDAQNEILKADAYIKNSAGDKIKKSLKAHKKAAKIYTRYYEILYNTGKEKLVELSENSETMKNSFDSLFSEAADRYRTAGSLRLKARKKKDASEAVKLYESARKNNIGAAEIQKESFAVYFKTLANGFDSDQAKVKSDTISEMPETGTSVKQNYTGESGDYRKTEEVNAENENNVQSGRADNKREETAQPGEVEYRLQIAASWLPAGKEQLKEMNPTTLDVKVYKHKRLYKYTIGSFKTPEEAKHYKNAFGLKNAIVVKYKNGKEIR